MMPGPGARLKKVLCCGCSRDHGPSEPTRARRYASSGSSSNALRDSDRIPFIDSTFFDARSGQGSSLIDICPKSVT